MQAAFDSASRSRMEPPKGRVLYCQRLGCAHAPTWRVFHIWNRTKSLRCDAHLPHAYACESPTAPSGKPPLAFYRVEPLTSG